MGVRNDFGSGGPAFLAGKRNKPLRAVITGGGTGGHIYPALAIARGLRDAVPDVKLLYIGTKTGLEARIVPAAGIRFKTIDIRGFERRLAVRNLKTAALLGKSFLEANSLLKSFKPDLVVGTGGYVCGPVVLAAAFGKLPTLIHEQNAYPGITNRALSRFADKVCITFPEAREHLHKKADIIETGLPVRPEILTAHREEAYNFLGLTPRRKTILVVGGSLGARSINQAIQPVLEWVRNSSSLQLVVVSGKDNMSQFASCPQGENIKIIPYLDRMDYGLAVANLVISRAGASFLAEVTAVGVGAILIPYPYASANHQEHNARSLEKRGAAKVLLEQEIQGDVLLETVQSMFRPGVLEEMGKNSRSMGKPQALSLITESILKLVD